MVGVSLGERPRRYICYAGKLYEMQTWMQTSVDISAKVTDTLVMRSSEMSAPEPISEKSEIRCEARFSHLSRTRCYADNRLSGKEGRND